MQVSVKGVSAIPYPGLRQKLGRFYGREMATLTNYELQLVDKLVLDIVNNSRLKYQDKNVVERLSKTIQGELARRPKPLPRTYKTVARSIKVKPSKNTKQLSA